MTEKETETEREKEKERDRDRKREVKKTSKGEKENPIIQNSSSEVSTSLIQDGVNQRNVNGVQIRLSEILNEFSVV